MYAKFNEYTHPAQSTGRKPAAFFCLPRYYPDPNLAIGTAPAY